MKNAKRYLLCLVALVVVFGTLTACGNEMTTYTYDNEAVNNIEIEKTEVYLDKLVIKFANNSLSKVTNVRCYGSDFSIVEMEPHFSFKRNTLTIETQNADMISGITVRVDNDFYFNVRYLDSDSYAMLVYDWVAYDIGFEEYGDVNAYNTEEEKDLQEARFAVLADTEEIAYCKMLGMWTNESETVRIEFSYTEDEFYKEITVHQFSGDEWIVERTVPITSASEQNADEYVQVTLFDNPSWGYAYGFYFYSDYTEMECEFSDERFVKM